MKNIIVLLVFLIFCNANAQLFSVSGKISDNSKQPLTGVNVVVKGRGDDKQGYRAEFIRLVKSSDNL